MASSAETPTTHYVGSRHTDQFLEARRKYSLSDKIVFKEYVQAPLFAALRKRAQRKVVDDPEFKSFEEGYPVMGGTMQACDAAGTAAAWTTSVTYLKWTNAGKQVQPGDMIHVAANQTNQTNAAGTVFLQGENMEVTQVVSDGIIRVSRNNGNGTNAGNVTAASGNTLSFIIVGQSFEEGSDAPESISDIVQTEQNYTQIFRETWEMTRTARATKLYGPDDFQRIARKKRKTFMRKIERAMLFGARDRKYVAGKYKRKMGGLAWYLANGSSDFTSWTAAQDMVNGATGNSRVWKVGDVQDTDYWSEAKIIKASEKIFRWGNKDKVMFCGGGFITEFQRLFANKIRLENDPKMFGLRNTVFETPHGRWNLVRHEEMTLGGYGNDCLVVDMEFLKYVVLQGEDVRVERNLQSNGAHTRKDGLTCEISMQMNFWDSHSWITGMTNTS